MHRVVPGVPARAPDPRQGRPEPAAQPEQVPVGAPPAAARTRTLALPGQSRQTRDAVRRALARLAALDGPHLSPLCGICELDEGFRLTYDLAPGSLTWGELTARRPATAGETVALGLALCQALGALHSAGLSHGDVGPQTVLVSPGGLVQLADCAAAWPAPAGGAAWVRPDPRADVAGLVALLEPGFGPGPAPGDLRGLLVSGADPEHTDGPTIPELGQALETAGEPAVLRPDAFVRSGAPTTPSPDQVGRGVEAATGPCDPATGPVTVVTQAPAGQDRSPTGSRTSRAGHPVRLLRVGGARARAVLLAGAALLGVLMVARGVVALASSAPAPVSMAAPGATRSAGGPALPVGGPDLPAAAELAATLAALDAARGAALAAGSPARLAAAVDPDGPAYARDVATLSARAQAGLRLVGGATTVHSVRPVSVGPDRAELLVTDSRAPYRLVGPDGAVLLAGPARPAVSWRVSLTREGVTGPWRVFDAVRS